MTAVLRQYAGETASGGPHIVKSEYENIAGLALFIAEKTVDSNNRAERRM